MVNSQNLRNVALCGAAWLVSACAPTLYRTGYRRPAETVPFCKIAIAYQDTAHGAPEGIKQGEVRVRDLGFAVFCGEAGKWGLPASPHSIHKAAQACAEDG